MIEEGEDLPEGSIDLTDETKCALLLCTHCYCTRTAIAHALLLRTHYYHVLGLDSIRFN